MRLLKKFKQLNWTAIIVESVITVLSILFALGVNTYREKLKKEELKKQTLENVTNELIDNHRKLEELIDNHKDKIKKITLLQQKLTPEEIANKTVLEIIFSLDNDALLKEPTLNNTAWETARLTNAVNLLDYKIVEKTSKLYNLQESSVARVWNIVTNFLLSREIFEKDKTETNLKMIQIYISELYRQEIYLKQQTSDLIRTLEKHEKE